MQPKWNVLFLWSIIHTKTHFTHYSCIVLPFFPALCIVYNIFVWQVFSIRKYQNFSFISNDFYAWVYLYVWKKIILDGYWKLDAPVPYWSHSHYVAADINSIHNDSGNKSFYRNETLEILNYIKNILDVR